MAQLSNSMREERTPLVTTDALLGLKEAVGQLGVPIDDELRAANLDPELLPDSIHYVSMTRIADFLAYLADKYQCPELGIRIAEHRPKTRFGLLTLLLQVSPNVKTALTHGHKHIGLITDSTRWDLDVVGRIARITRTDIYSFGHDLSQLHLLSIAQYVQLMKAFCGIGWHPKAVYFTHGQPEDTSYYKWAFRCKVNFASRWEAFEFPADDLNTPIPTHDPVIFESLLKHLEFLENQKDSDEVCENTRNFIRRRLGTGTCNLLGAASYLGIHPKALQRELAAQGCTFQKLLTESRHEMAVHHLEHTGVSLKQLAGILGYSDPSSFSRAFSNQAGMSPKAWRIQQVAG